MLRQIQTSHAPWKPRGSLKPHCPPVCSLQYIYKWLWPLYFLTTILLPNKEIIFNITDKSKSLDRPKYIHSWSTRCLINNYEISSQQNTTWILKEVPDSLFVLVSQHSLDISASSARTLHQLLPQQPVLGHPQPPPGLPALNTRTLHPQHAVLGHPQPPWCPDLEMLGSSRNMNNLLSSNMQYWEDYI